MTDEQAEPEQTVAATQGQNPPGDDAVVDLPPEDRDQGEVRGGGKFGLELD